MFVLCNTLNIHLDDACSTPDSCANQLDSVNHLLYFKDASLEELEEMRKIRTVVKFKEGESVFFGETYGKGFFYLNAGYVKKIYQHGNQTETLRIAGAGDLVGYARPDSSAGKYGIVALTPVIASFFEIDAFAKLKHKSNYVSNEITRWFINLLMQQEHYILSMRLRFAKDRVACTLFSLSKSFGNTIGGGRHTNSVPVDRKTIAELSGVAVEVLSRVLNELEEDEVIRREGRAIIITNNEKLEALSPLK